MGCELSVFGVETGLSEVGQDNSHLLAPLTLLVLPYCLNSLAQDGASAATAILLPCLNPHSPVHTCQPQVHAACQPLHAHHMPTYICTPHANPCVANSAGRLHSGIAAVLVEGQRMYYVYRRTAQREESGLQDIVEMQLCEGESVLGARLVELAPQQAGGASTGSDAAYTGAAAAADAAAAGRAVKSPGVALLLLTQNRLLLHHLTVE